ncbi:hypothetical protein HYX13_02845 [Candidatus Woesearchaeota archaeon]|nr:hypothetical protein [Candidatus Woesearchaeota archaeon]
MLITKADENQFPQGITGSKTKFQNPSTKSQTESNNRLEFALLESGI